MNEPLPPIPQNTSYRIRDVEIAPAAVLAPMEGVTDVVFRRLIREIGGVGMTYTEFLPSRALVGNAEKVMNACTFDPSETPLTIQIYGREPEVMAEAAQIVQELGATVVDINMGCPAKKVCANSGGSGLLREPELALEIVKAVRKVVTVPLTVKMRTGYDHSNRNGATLAYQFQEEGVDAITLHWRTKVDLYEGVRDVSIIKDAVERLSIPVVGNGDIIDITSAYAMFEETGCAGVMLGRGAVRDPWVFLKIYNWMHGLPQPVIDAQERKRVLLRYHQLMLEALGSERGALARLKMVTKYFFEPTDVAQVFRKSVLRSETTEEALQHIHAHFDADHQARLSA
jgi:nifR3 family TIM-barrel protein